MKKMTRKAMPLFKSSAATATTGPPSSTSTASSISSISSSSGGGILRRMTWADKIRDKLPPLEENEYEVLWERGVLGVIFLESERDGIPYVSKATETCISPEVQPGDTLKFVNIVRSKDHSFSDFFKILATMKKPVLLRFERANAGTPTSDDGMGVGIAHPGFDQRSNSSSSLDSASAPDSPRSAKYQRANSVPPNEQKPPKSFNSRGAFWRASSGRDSTIPPPSNALSSPAPRDDNDGIYRVTRENDVSPQHTPNGSVRTPREPAYQEYEVYWETGSLGLFFGEDRLTNLPVVTRSTSNANAVVQRMVAVNDTLVSANSIQSRDYSFDAFFSRLQQMNKPVRLVFRRPRRESSSGSMTPGRNPSMMVDTSLSPSGANLRHRQLSGGESPLSGRGDTPPLPPSPQVNVAINQQQQRDTERSRGSSPHSPFTAPNTAIQARASTSKAVSTHTPVDHNGTVRKARPYSTTSVPTSFPNGSDEAARQQLPSSTNGSMGTRSSMRVLRDASRERFSVRGSERRGASSRGNLETNFRLSSKTSPRTVSPQHSDSASWSTAAPSPTIHTSLDDSAPTATTPPHAHQRPSPIVTSDSYQEQFGSPDSPDKDNASQLHAQQDHEVPTPKLASPLLSPTLSSPTTPAPPAKPDSPVKSPVHPVSASDIWSMASEDPAEDLPTSPEPPRGEYVPTAQDAWEPSEPGVPSASAAEKSVPTVSLDEDLARPDSESSLEDAPTAVDHYTTEAEDARNDAISASGSSALETASLPVRLSSGDEPDNIYSGEVAEVEVGTGVDTDDEYQLRDEVDLGNDGFSDDGKRQIEMLDMDSISIEERAPSRLLDEDGDEIELRVDGSKRESSVDLDSKADDPIDDVSEAISSLVTDPDISSDVDVVAANVMGEASKIKGDVIHLTKVNKPALNANLAKYKKKGKSSRGITKLPALGESEALTVPLVAPNAVNTTVQVRGRPKPKLTMMDTPDAATYLIKWKENRSIGLQLKEVRFAKGVYPLVTDVCQESCCEALKHICIGDVIVEINGKNTSTMGVKKTVNFLKSCSKTTLMKLRHGPSYVSQRVSAYI